MSFGVAVHVMLALAYNEDRRLNSKQLAASIGANPVTIRRVVAQLAAADLVDTQSGPKGGARLAKPAEEIHLNEVLDALGQPRWVQGHDNKPNPECIVSVCMPRIMYRLNDAIDAQAQPFLQRATLRDLVDEEIQPA